MTFRKGETTPNWNRDEEEYKDLNIIEDHVRGYSHILRSWTDFDGHKIGVNEWITNLRGYLAAIYNYFKWIRPYLEHFNERGELLKIQSLLEISDELLNEGDDMLEYNPYPNAFKEAFIIIERVENHLKAQKVKHHMGVRLDYTPDENELEHRRIKNNF